MIPKTALFMLINILAAFTPFTAGQNSVQQTLSIQNQTITLKTIIPVKKDYHLYGPDVQKPFFATKLHTPNTDKITWETTKYPKTKKYISSGITVDVLEADTTTNAVTIITAGRIATDTPVDSLTIESSLTYQECSEDQCLPPVQNKKLIIQQNTKEVNKNDIIPENFGSSVKVFSLQLNLSSSGTILPLIVAFVAGLLLNIMPCVLPVIPLKIMQLAKQAQQEHRHPIILSLVFSFGIISFFAIIGISASAIKGTFNWGQTFQNPHFITAISLILLFLSLGMFGVFQVAVPGFIANRSIVRKGLIGAYGMGLLAGVLSTPCSFGLLGAAVTWAQLQSTALTIIAFIVIGLGMAFPYILMSSSPFLINKLPKPGAWTEYFERIMGFLLLAVAAFLLTALPKDRLVSVLMGMIGLSFVIWFWAKAFALRTSISSRIGKSVLFIILLVLVGHLFHLDSNKKSVVSFSPETLRSALDAKRTIIVDFTADWCLNCRTVDSLVFGNERVINYIRQPNVALLKADLTQDNPFAQEKLKEWTGQSGIPFTVIIKPDGKKILLSGIYSPSTLLDSLSR